MKYSSVDAISSNWNISKRRVLTLCSEGRIEGAFKIGNVWAIPSDSKKPEDKRFSKKKVEYAEKEIRAEIRKISVFLYHEVLSRYEDPFLSKTKTIALLSYLLLCKINTDCSEFICKNYIETLYEIFLSQTDVEILSRIENSFAFEPENYLDSTLSWAYQYTSKESQDTEYVSTQFFTEQYMIDFLYKNLEIKADDKTIDPACGGGNFLLKAFDKYSEMGFSDINYLLDRIWGYDIDSTLAKCAAMSLVLKALKVANENAVSINLDKLKVNIFYSKNDTLLGSLDVNAHSHIIVNAITKEERMLSDIWENANHIVTNPPFKTMKGMDINLREALKNYYPMSKADMCNCFIESIIRYLDDKSDCAIVSQTSWLYLSSFAQLREHILEQCDLKVIADLGSNAFYDLSGEKSNVALIVFKKKSEGSKTSVYNLRNKSKEEIKTIFAYGLEKDYLTQSFNPSIQPVLESNQNHLSFCQMKYPKYEEFGTPMQGTSTGDSKNLVNYFWLHFNDPNWKLVSKGGGFCRWYGLNSYVVHWGLDGEIIRNTPGSALRNTKYFSITDFVFSDTGTAGLNCRELLADQLFIASGPGIRRTLGLKYAHLAYLNSRFASYLLRLTSPKLTIAAGYIAKLPIAENILGNKKINDLGFKATEIKKKRMQHQPTEISFCLNDYLSSRSLNISIDEFMMQDLSWQLEQLITEITINDCINKAFSLSKKDLDAMDEIIGHDYLFFDKEISMEQIDELIFDSLDLNCTLKKNRKVKNSLASDSVLEYICRSEQIRPEILLSRIKTDFDILKKTREKYANFFIHNLIIFALGYPKLDKETAIDKTPYEKLLNTLISLGFVFSKDDEQFIFTWVEKHFTRYHEEIFLKKPIWGYQSGNIEIIGDLNWI